MIQREQLELPNGANKLLLHSCCAPCSGEVMEALIASNIDFTIFFYNPNIHPHQEYEIRKNENIKFAKQHNIPFIDADYDKDEWFARAKGMENEPERGIRCIKLLSEKSFINKNIVVVFIPYVTPINGVNITVETELKLVLSTINQVAAHARLIKNNPIMIKKMPINAFMLK